MVNPISKSIYFTFTMYQNFIDNNNIPLSKAYLQLALDNYDLSYDIQNRDLAFLSLMISMKVLLNPSESELKYRLSRNAAVLLGKEFGSESVYKDISNLYIKRSKLVHTGTKDAIKLDDLLLLRSYVRESIKKAINLDLDKDTLMKLLHKIGYDSSITT